MDYGLGVMGYRLGVMRNVREGRPEHPPLRFRLSRGGGIDHYRMMTDNVGRRE